MQWKIANNKATVACSDSGANYHGINMYQSNYDSSDISNLLPSSAANVTQAYVVWAAAARQIRLNVFQPNDRANSVLRPSLVAKNLDSLSFAYSGTNLK